MNNYSKLKLEVKTREKIKNCQILGGYATSNPTKKISVIVRKMGIFVFNDCPNKIYRIVINDKKNLVTIGVFFSSFFLNFLSVFFLLYSFFFFYYYFFFISYSVLHSFFFFRILSLLIFSSLLIFVFSLNFFFIFVPFYISYK